MTSQPQYMMRTGKNHDFIKDDDLFKCAHCNLWVPIEGAWQQALDSTCKKNTHQWRWQQEKLRYYCYQCSQDVNYVELSNDTGFNPNNLIGPSCPGSKYHPKYKQVKAVPYSIELAPKDKPPSQETYLTPQQRLDHYQSVISLLEAEPEPEKPKPATKPRFALEV